MKDIITIDFLTSCNVDTILSVCQEDLSDMEWSIRESEYDDRYVLGKTKEANKVRIIDYDDYKSAEIYFSRLSEEEHKKETIKIIEGLINGLPESKVLKTY